MRNLRRSLFYGGGGGGVGLKHGMLIAGASNYYDPQSKFYWPAATFCNAFQITSLIQSEFSNAYCIYSVWSGPFLILQCLPLTKGTLDTTGL